MCEILFFKNKNNLQFQLLVYPISLILWEIINLIVILNSSKHEYWKGSFFILSFFLYLFLYAFFYLFFVYLFIFIYIYIYLFFKFNKYFNFFFLINIYLLITNVFMFKGRRVWYY